MRAGKYAEFEGVTWPADFSPQGGPVYLNAYGKDSPGLEFTPGDVPGHWERRVDREDCSRLFYVATSAYWLDVYPTEVTRARGDGTVEIFCSPLNAFPAPPGSIHDLDWAPARRRLREERLVGYYGVVPENELSHVIEESHEIGTTPDPSWRTPRRPLLPSPSAPPTTPDDRRARRKQRR